MAFGNSIDRVELIRTPKCVDMEHDRKVAVTTFLENEIPGLDDLGSSLINTHLTDLNPTQQKRLIQGVQQQLKDRGYKSIGTIDGLGGTKTKRALRMVKTLQLIGNQDISTVGAVQLVLSEHTKAQIIDMQQLLSDEGFSIQVDGMIGPQTTEALQAFVEYCEEDVEVVGQLGDECTSLQNEVIQDVDQRTRSQTSFDDQIQERMETPTDLQLQRMQEYRELHPENFVPKTITDAGHRFLNSSVLQYRTSQLQEGVDQLSSSQISERIGGIYGFGLHDYEYHTNLQFKNFLNDIETFFDIPNNFLYNLMIAESGGKRVITSYNATSFGLFQHRGDHGQHPTYTQAMKTDPVAATLGAAIRLMPGGDLNPNGLNDITSMAGAYNGGGNRMYSPKPHDTDKYGANQGKPMTAQTLYLPQRRYAVKSSKPYSEGRITAGIPEETRRHALKITRATDPERYDALIQQAGEIPSIQATLQDDIAYVNSWREGDSGRKNKSFIELEKEISQDVTT